MSVSAQPVENPRPTASIRLAGLAVTEQALFGGSTFLINILLARWLDQAHYGTFAVGSTIFLLIGALHTAVLSEPMVVFGVGKYADRFPEYFRIVFRGHWLLAGLAAGLLAVGAAGVAHWGSRDLGQTLAGLAIAAPCVLLLWLLRRIGYGRARLGTVLAASALYVFCAAGAVTLLHHWGLLSPSLAFLSMGVGALAAGALLVWDLGLTHRSGGTLSPAEVVADHWTYGSWSALATAVYWCSGQILLLLIPTILGLRAAAAAAAVANLYRPLNTLMQSGSNTILPEFARLSLQGGPDTRAMVRISVPFVSAFVIYALAISLLGKLVLALVYSGRYDDYYLLVWLYGGIYVASAVVQVLCWALKASGHARSVVWVWTASAATVLLVAAPAMHWGGLPMAVALNCLSYVLAACMAAYQIRALRRSPPANTPADGATA